jgi:hypothetical protein
MKVTAQGGEFWHLDIVSKSGRRARHYTAEILNFSLFLPLKNRSAPTELSDGLSKTVPVDDIPATRTSLMR